MSGTIGYNHGSNRWQVLQPAIYLISILPSLAWFCILESSPPQATLLLTTLAVVLIQHGINVLNDAVDWEKGADSNKQLSWVHFHQINLKAVRLHGFISFWIGTILGCGLVSHLKMLEVFYVALPLVALGYCYNSNQWTLSYTALGEWVTALCYGPGVFGCIGYLLVGRVSLINILGSLAFASLAVAVLLSHQPPQVLNDFLAGKMSFAVRNGPKRTFLVAKILQFLSQFLLIVIFSLTANTPWYSLILFIFGSVLISITFRFTPTPKTILLQALALIGGAFILKIFEEVFL